MPWVARAGLLRLLASLPCAPHPGLVHVRNDKKTRKPLPEPSREVLEGGAGDRFTASTGHPRCANGGRPPAREQQTRRQSEPCHKND